MEICFGIRSRHMDGLTLPSNLGTPAPNVSPNSSRNALSPESELSTTDLNSKTSMNATARSSKAIFGTHAPYT